MQLLDEICEDWEKVFDLNCSLYYKEDRTFALEAESRLQ
jgi:hypothetical protein